MGFAQSNERSRGSKRPGVTRVGREEMEMKMITTKSPGLVALAVAVVGLAAHAARADVTGSFDGQASGPRVAVPINAAATFKQTGKAVTGTIAVDGPLAGAYLVSGKATVKKLIVSGLGPNRAKLKWKGKIVGDTISGKAKLIGTTRVIGILSFTRNVSTSDGSGCDSVYDAHTSQFVDQVLGQALTTCTTCHGPGLQAGSTRLLVSVADPLATARSVATMVNSADPDASRILEKPLLLVPHGGGQRILPGSAEETILHDWVTLIAQAQCN